MLDISKDWQIKSQPQNGSWLEATEHLSTIADWIRFAVSSMEAAHVFYGHGCDNARDEAIYLVQKALYLPVDHIESYYLSKLLPNERQKLAIWLKKRIQDRIPTAYLAQEAWLQGQAFYVDERVIIPRSFIAEWLPEQLSPWVHDPQAITSVLDVCTGSGCLAILAALHFPHAKVDALDISEHAIEVSDINIRNHHLENRVTAFISDLFSSEKISTYDLILTNPPYVNSASMASLPKEYQAEPVLALAGGEDGMDLIRRIIAQAKKYLKPQGLLVLEIGHEKPYFEAAFPDLDMTWLSVSAGDDLILLIEREALP